MEGVPYDFIQHPLRVQYAPMLETIEVLPPLAPPAPLASYLQDGPPPPPRPIRKRRLLTVEVLPPLQVAPISPYLPYDMMLMRTVFSSAPRIETIESLPPLQPVAALLPWWPGLDMPPAVSRFTIITPYQDHVSDMPLIPATPIDYETSSSVSRVNQAFSSAKKLKP